MVANTDQPISLDTTPTQTSISLDTGNAENYMLSPELISQRAAKFTYAMANTPAAQPEDATLSALQNDDEVGLRKSAASAINADLSSKRYDLISQTISKKQDALTPDDMKNIDLQGGFSFPYKYPRDPNSILEQNYASQYMSEFDAFAQKSGDSNFWNVANQVARNDVQATLMFGDVTTAQHQYLLTKAQDANAKIENQSNFGYGVDLAKMMFPILNPYYELKMRGNVPGVSFFSGLLGSQLEEQRLKLHSLPFDQFTDTVDKIYDKLSADNPQAAAAWVGSMLGQSSSDYILNQANTIGHALDIPIIAKVGKVAYSGITLQSSVAGAMKTALKAANTPEATKADLFASVGDLAAAGRVNANNLLTGRIAGSISPVEEAAATLPTNLNLLKKDIESTTHLSQTFQNVLLQQTDGAISDSLRVLADTLRPTRVQLERISDEALDKVSKTITDRYPKDNDAILRKSDPVYNPISKTYDVTLNWGKDGGVYFNDLHEAADATMAKGFRVTFTPEQLADIDARITSIKEELGSPGKDLSDAIKTQHDLEKADLNLTSKAEEIGSQYGRDSAAYSGAIAERESNRGALRTSNQRVSELRKANIDAGPSMHEDVHGMNYYDTLPDTLKSLEDKRAAVSRPGGATIKQQGLSFYAERTVPVRELDKEIMNLTASPDNPLAVSPDSWTKEIPYLNHFRTAEDTFSPEARANRKAALFPQAAFRAMVKNEGQIISDFFRGKTMHDPVTGEVNPFWKRGVPGVRSIMNRDRLKNFLKVLDYSQNEAIDPVTKKEGYWLKPSELNDFYLRNFQRSASFEETQAYEAIKRWDELQRIFTQVMVYRGQARRGNETHVLISKAADGTEIRSNEFVGAQLRKFPRGRGSVLVMGDDLKSSVVKDLDRASEKARGEWADKVKNGYRIIQIDDPEQMPFKDFGVQRGDSLIHYVLAPKVETSALRWDTLPKTGGGRFVYDYNMYIKQPKMKFETIDGQRKSHYLGDQTVAPVGYKDLGEDVARKMSATRRLIAAGDEEGAKAHYINNGLEGALEPYGKFRAKFEGYKDEVGSWHEPVYNKEEDFRVVPRNKSVIEVHKAFADKYGPDGVGKFKNTFRDATRENSPARNFQIQFTGERDAQGLQSIDNVGTIQNPIYKKTPAQKIDPMTMLNRGMNSTINSLFMDDYKTYAVNNWLKEATGKKILKARDSEVWSSPFGTFNTITRDSFLPGTPQREVNGLMANHFKIEQLVGTPTVLDTFVHQTAQNIADAAYRTLGPTKASYITPTWLIPKLRDPFAFIRSVTFNAYLGLFSVPQMLVQSMNYVNMFAIAPKYASQGTLATYLHYLSRFNKNPEILSHLDTIATKFGYKPGEWLEAMREFENTGFAHVGAEHGLMDNMHRTNIIQRGSDKFLEWGRKPFQWGETNSRIGGWYTAMKEFRDQHPTGALSDIDRSQILDKADFYQGNMSTASHSMLNSGIFSLPTQFYMYTTRLAEIFWSGSRLGGTVAERNLARVRLVAANGAMFGLPMAVGVSGLPVSDYLRKELLDNGYFGLTPPYVVGNNFVESMINEGLPAAALHIATGHNYNVGPREGLQGLSNLAEAMSQDAAFYKVMGGASASLSLNTINNGIFPLVYQMYQGNFKNLKMEDFVDVFKEVQVVSSGWAWWVAMNTGIWANKNSDIISKVSKDNASFMFLSGLRETKQSDNWDKEQVIKDRNDLQKYALKQFTLNMNRATIADANGDEEQAQAFRTKAIAWLPATAFPPEKLGNAIVKASKNAQPLPDRTNQDFYSTKATQPNTSFFFQRDPATQREKLRKAFESLPNE